MPTVIIIPDYTFYQDVYMGAIIPQNQFDRIIQRANDKLLEYETLYTVTYIQRDTEPPEYARGRALCALGEQVYSTEQASGTGSSSGAKGILKSQSIGSITQSWDSISAEKVIESTSKRYIDSIRPYATIYRGVKRVRLC